ncbi:MAG: DUF3048 domain-containing protein, partial [Clostridia bacterium]|nr:DUF3048 domain-containing protein [Clostridia bacterium]
MNRIKFSLRAVSLLLCLVFALSCLSCGKSSGDNPGADKSAADGGMASPDAPVDAIDDADFEALEPENVNPLTGLEASYDVSTSRPIAVMLNNIWEALPQVGIGNADILFECLAEGGITRMLGFFSEYKDLDVIGSVRSSRPYYIDFAQMFDAIYCHAGGSEDAYSQLASRGINNIDGVRGDPLGVYYRDETRMQTMAYEHTLMTTGAGLVQTIEYCGYRTELREGFKYPFEFAPYGEVVKPDGEMCLKIHLPISTYQTVDYEYDKKEGKYLRFQYNGTPHIDGATGEQLSFTNVIILFCNTYAYDSYGRLHVDTVGEGDGYLASAGEYIPIKWSRTDIDGDLTLTRADNGKTITLNRGKTFV